MQARRYPLGMVLAIPLVLSPLSALASFNDVKPGDPYADGIFYVQATGIVQGYQDGTYLPTAAITRAEFTKIMVEAKWKTIPEDLLAQEKHRVCLLRPDDPALLSFTFPDVPPGSWFFEYVCQAKAYEWISGHPDGEFKPHDFLRVSEAAKIIAGAFLESTEAQEGDEWYSPFLRALTEQGLLPESAADPGHLLTRGEMAEIIYRLQTGKKSDVVSGFAYASSSGSDAETPSPWSTSAYEYILRYRNEEHGTTEDPRIEEPDDWDAKLIRKNRETHEEEILFESIKDVVPAIQEPWHHTLKIFAHPENENTVFFQTVQTETERIPGMLFAFDVDTLTFTHMKVNEIYGGLYGGFAWDPVQKIRFVWSPNTNESGDARMIYLIDLLKDDYHVLMELSQGETLNGGWAGEEVSFDIRWDENGTVKYAVYDQTKKEEPYGAPFLDYRMVEAH